ncbi:MAG: type II toxin-antitoxin system HicA family toxin [Halobacteriota archaeon]
MIIKARKIDSSLTRKGFIKEEGRKHTFYFFVVDGKKTLIRTHLSHGDKDCDDYLLSEIRKQLKFDKKGELIDFIDCTKMNFEEYLSMLTDKSIKY